MTSTLIEYICCDYWDSLVPVLLSAHTKMCNGLPQTGFSSHIIELKFQLQMWKYSACANQFFFHILLPERRFIDFQTSMVDISQCIVLTIPVQCTSLYCTTHQQCDTILHCTALHISLWYCTADYTLLYCTFYTTPEMKKRSNMPSMLV